MTYLDTILKGPSQSYNPNVAHYTENQVPVLPVRLIANNNDKYVFIFSDGTNCGVFTVNQINKTTVKHDLITGGDVLTASLSVNDCVIKCQNVLGLKINEIAKLVGVSRATLDLHRKGANVKDMASYNKLYDFVSTVDDYYGNQVKGGLRNVLINKKTLVQHFIDNVDCLMNTMPQVDEVIQKLGHMKLINSTPNQHNLHTRLRGIGKMM